MLFRQVKVKKNSFPAWGIRFPAWGIRSGWIRLWLDVLTGVFIMGND